MGHVELGKRVFVGSGARIMPGVRIGDDVKIGAGATVLNDVAAGATVYGPPARTL
jgi:acetyltransferase-like isoleucine patch superfamily enzyme